MASGSASSEGWESRWYAEQTQLQRTASARIDKLRKLIRKRLYNAAVSRIEIERVAGTQISVAIHTAKPGIVIGKSGESVERLRQQLETRRPRRRCASRSWRSATPRPRRS